VTPAIFRKALFWLVFSVFLGTPLQSALALEIYRNSKRYDIAATLPDGIDFTPDRIDRKFSFGGVEGNLRLIQDDYGSCGELIEERAQNWIKHGFSQSSNRHTSRKECSIAIRNPDTGEVAVSYYVQVDACACFAAVHFRFDVSQGAQFERLANVVVPSIRQNHSRPSRDLVVAPAGDTIETPVEIVKAEEPVPLADAPLEDAKQTALPANVGPGMERLVAIVRRYECGQFNKRYSQQADTDLAMVLLTAWTGRNLDQLAKEAGVPGLSPLITQAGGLPPLEGRAATMVPRLLAVHADTIGAMEAYADKYGDRLCPMMGRIFSASLADTMQKQREIRSPYHGYLTAAQVLMRFHGCFSGEIDGAFGAESRKGWQRMLQGLGREGRDMPTAADVVDMAAVPVSSGACAADGAFGLPAAPLDFLMAQEETGGGWVMARNAHTSALLDDFAEKGEWTPWQRTLLHSLVPVRSDMPEGESERWIARLYGRGVGVRPNAGAAAYWMERGRSAKSLYERYLEALDEPALAGTAAIAFIEKIESGKYDRGVSTAGPIRIDNDARISVANMGDFSRLSELVIRRHEALEAILASKGAAFKFSLAERLLAGAAPSGKAPELAARLLQSAADEGADYAASRLAFLTLHGFGTAADAGKALTLAGQAAAKDEPFGLYLMAGFLEGGQTTDRSGALAVYKRLLSLDSHFLPTSLVINRLMSGNAALSARDGRKLVEAAAKKNVNLVRSLAELALCVQCGGTLDVADAANWLRRLPEYEAKQEAFTLYRLLKAFPELRKSTDEPRAVLSAAVSAPEKGTKQLFGWGTSIPAYLALKIEEIGRTKDAADVPKEVAKFLEHICEATKDDMPQIVCPEAARYLASGMFGGALVGAGIDALTTLDRTDLFDALAAYGDFKGALAVLQRAQADGNLAIGAFTAGGLVAEGAGTVYSLRSPTFRRIVAQRNTRDASTLPEGFMPLLRFLALHGDGEARDYVRLIDGTPEEAPADVVATPQEAEAVFAAVKTQRGLSRAFVNAARTSASANRAEGRKDVALSMELTALAAEIRLDAIAAIDLGPLQGALTSVCHLSRASERVFALEADAVAMVLAKDAINRLQVVRRDLSTIPEKLQGCFRDLVSDNYRWLADLLVRENRLGEARFVLGLLKDFEAFQFVGRDADFAGEAFQEIPYTAEEQQLRAALDALVLPVVPDGRRANELRLQRAVRALTQPEQRELSGIEAELQEADRAYAQSMNAIMAAAGVLTETDVASPMPDTLGPSQAIAKAEAGKGTVIVHYLVMPERLNIIVTTAAGPKSTIVTEWNGKPFAETELNAEIDRFRRLLSRAVTDPMAQGQKLYDLLVAPIRAELDVADARLLLLSLDKRLRYLPFAALHDGRAYLAETYDTSVLTNSAFEASGETASDVPFAALGMTQAVGNFSALPGVAIELEGLVKGDDRAGIFDGEVALDEAFDRDALMKALATGSTAPTGLAIVHIASHFALGKTDVDSSLLLGTGELLSLREIKNDKARYDFRHVELLTLSACETGFAAEDADGREIDSLSKVTSDRGAQSTLASLWQVSDPSTALMMQRFYELRTMGGLSKAAAMGAVQREFIRGDLGSRKNLDGRSIVYDSASNVGHRIVGISEDGIDMGFSHPFYWAPFILTGNWR
jgi:CHAT domain-containing protein/TPR repeat protein